MLGKNLKKLLALLLALAMVFALCACNAPTADGDGDEEKEGSGNQIPSLEEIDPDNMTDKEYMLAVEQHSIQGAVGVLMQVLDGHISMDSIGTELELTVRPGAQLLQLLQANIIPTEDFDLSGLKSIGLDMSVNMNDQLTQMLIGISINGKKLADVDLIADMAAASIWLGLPGLVDEYLQLDAETLGSMGSAAGNEPNYDESWSSSEQAGMAMAPAAILEILPEILPDTEKLEPLLNKYIGIMLNAIEDVKRESVQVEIDGAKQDAVKLTYTITEQNAAKMALAVLKAAKDDADLKVVVDELAADLASLTFEMDAAFDMDLWTMFKSVLEGGIAYFEPYANGDVSAVNSGNKIIITTTLDGSHKVIGRSFAMYTNNRPDVQFEFLSVTEGDLRNFDLTAITYSQNLSSGISVKGHSTLSGGVAVAGAYNLFMVNNGDEYKMLTVDLSDMSDTSGTIIITPAPELFRMIFGGVAEMNASLILSLKEETITIELLMEGEMIIGIDLTAKQTTPGTVQKPTNIFDAASGNLSSWLTEDALNKLIENWNATGMPEIVLPE